jgi:hypothetical protein
MEMRIPKLGWKDVRHLFSVWGQDFTTSALYWKIDGRPVCSILNLTDFTYHYGLITFRLLLLYGRKVLQEKLGEDPYIIGLVSEANARNAYIASSLPLDAVTGYALLPNWRGPSIQHYQDLIEQRVRGWYMLQNRLSIPFFPVASAGWDASVRGERLASLNFRIGFPWTPIVVGVTPDLFGSFIDKAIAFNLENHPTQNIVFIHAWNEWTESSVVEPSDRFGTEMLEQVRKRSQSFQAMVTS